MDEGGNKCEIVQILGNVHCGQARILQYPWVGQNLPQFFQQVLRQDEYVRARGQGK
jgi:hypothetical protein